MVSSKSSRAKSRPAKAAVKPAHKAAAEKTAIKSESKQAKRHAIVVCCSPDWMPLASFALFSCLEQGADQIADLYVITCEAQPLQHQQVIDYFKQHGCDINLLDVKLTPSLKAIVEAKASTPGALMRMGLHDFLPSHYDRVLYLDSDIMALQPISLVLDTNLNGKPLGAVEDFHSMPGPLRRWDDHPRAAGLPEGARYFNSGMMLFDWQMTLRLNLLQKSIDLWLDKLANGGKLIFPDQDALNIGFHGHWQPLPVSMNASSVLIDYFPEKPILRHFSAHYRPWAEYWMPGLARFKQRYREMAAQGPWRNFQVKPFSTVDFKELAGIFVRRMDFISRARYQKHVASGLVGAPADASSPPSSPRPMEQAPTS